MEHLNRIQPLSLFSFRKTHSFVRSFRLCVIRIYISNKSIQRHTPAQRKIYNNGISFGLFCLFCLFTYSPPPLETSDKKVLMSISKRTKKAESLAESMRREMNEQLMEKIDNREQKKNWNKYLWLMGVILTQRTFEPNVYTKNEKRVREREWALAQAKDGGRHYHNHHTTTTAISATTPSSLYQYTEKRINLGISSELFCILFVRMTTKNEHLALNMHSL